MNGPVKFQTAFFIIYLDMCGLIYTHSDLKLYFFLNFVRKKYHPVETSAQEFGSVPTQWNPFGCRDDCR